MNVVDVVNFCGMCDDHTARGSHCSAPMTACRLRLISPSCMRRQRRYAEEMSASPRVLRNYLKTHRKRSGLSQRELAYLLGCKHGSKVSRYERGERLPGLATVLGFEIIFRSRARELFAGIHDGIAREIIDRATLLHKRIETERRTPLLKQKTGFLVEIVFPTKEDLRRP